MLVVAGPRPAFPALSERKKHLAIAPTIGRLRQAWCLSRRPNLLPMSALWGKAPIGRLLGLMVHNPPGENQGHPTRDFSYLAYFGIPRGFFCNQNW
jgi:hypothetical protein